MWLVVALVAVAAAAALWVYHGVVKPAKVARLGMELLTAQDTNSRLRKTGNHQADRVADLYNTLMERLHEQMLHNREQDRLLSQLISASPMGVAMMDLDGRISEANPAFMHLLGLRRENPIGKHLEELPGELASALASAPEGESTIQIAETEIYRCRRLSFLDRGFNRPFILLDNMAEEVRRIEQAAYAKVIRVMAHEVNNSLGGVGSLLETLETIHSEDPMLSEVIESGRERCRSLGLFVNSYADVVRLPDPRMEAADLNDEMRRLHTFLQSIAGTRAEVSLSLSDQRLGVRIDKVQMERVMVNIVKNAAESISSGARGEIKITTGREKGAALLTVENNGTPIGKEHAMMLFTPFYTTKPGGKGIGLTLVSEILRRHGCRYSLRSDDGGKTTFRIEFP